MTKSILEKIKEISTPCNEGFLLKVKIVANSKQNSFEFTGLADYPLKLKIAKPAVDGKANEEVVKYLSKILNVPKNYISIVKGEKSPIKTLFITK